MTTGSIASNTPLSPLLRPQEWTAASYALVKALDPAQTGPADWVDKEAGVTVSFRAEGEAYIRNDQVCRTFVADVRLQGSDSSHLGTACRVGAGEWTVHKIKPWVKPA